MLILVLGWSRLQLGVNFPIDTLAGFAVGAVVLGLFVRWRGPVASWFDQHPPLRQVGIALVASLALIGLAVAVRTTLGATSIPPDETDGEWWRRALRYPIGLIGVVALVLGRGDDPTGDSLPALVTLFVQYSLIGLWIGGLAPLLFVVLRLAPARSTPESS